MSNTLDDCGCVDDGCGIGGWKGPKPGDPDNSSRISADTVTGGIRVNWTYPAINPHAVAYYTLYRATVNDLANAGQVTVVSGGTYFDQLKVSQDTQYFYWIKQTSVHGTEESHIGPAMAWAKPLRTDVTDALTGAIGEVLLDGYMSDRIERITRTQEELLGRIGELASHDEVAARAYADFRSGVTEQLYYSFGKMDVIINGQTVMRRDIEAVAMANQNASLLIENIRQMGVDNQQAIYQESQARTLAFQEQSAAFRRDIQQVANSTSASIRDVQTWQASAGNTIASVQNTVNVQANKLGQMEATYLLKLSNGVITGGLGMSANSDGIAVGFYANNFYIKEPTTGVTFTPFRVQNGKVYIEEAIIGTATIGTLNIKGGATGNMDVHTNNTAYRVFNGSSTSDLIKTVGTVQVSTDGAIAGKSKVLINGTVCVEGGAISNGYPGYLYLQIVRRVGSLSGATTVIQRNTLLSAPLRTLYTSGEAMLYRDSAVAIPITVVDTSPPNTSQTVYYQMNLSYDGEGSFTTTSVALTAMVQLR